MKGVFEVFDDCSAGAVFKSAFSKLIGKQISNIDYIKQLFVSKSGLEVGGPSRVFRDEGYVPLYRFVKELDGCNFSNTTIWEGNINSGKNYNYYKNRKGMQYISEASDLSLIPDSKYDFVISSNCLEHVANPLKAVEEWIRVIKDGGLLLLVLPKKDYCFDHNRPDTLFSHLLSDFQNNIDDKDLTHLNEILELHDLKRDKHAGSLDQFKQRSLKNFENRALHHHVFSIPVLKEIFSYFNLEVLLTHDDRKLIILGKKKVS
jgi:SAM-dependent methyltransferase